MQKGTYYNERRRYLEKLTEVLAVIQDFNEIKYVHEYYDDAEYVVITDVLGGAVFVDITAKTLEEIFKEVTKVINGQTPNGLVTNINIKRHIATALKK